MKTEREIYLKPLTLREQVAMEQGICAGSIFDGTLNTVYMTSAAQGYEEVSADEASFVGDNTGSNGEWEIEWK